MIYAIDASGVRIEAAPDRIGFCPGCGEPLVPRCGQVKVWHWAHPIDTECDPWWEPETAWHREWKLHCPIDRVEVCMGEHRADIVATDGAVIELQHSSISIDEIRDRERFYGRMLWLLDGAPFIENLRVESAAGIHRFTWAYGRPTWLAARKPIFVHGFTVGHYIRVPNPRTGRIERHWRSLNSSSDVLQIKELKSRPYVHGTGRVIKVDRFIERLLREKETIP